MFDFVWIALGLCALGLGQMISVKVTLDVVDLLKYLEERKKDKKDR